MRGEIPVRSDIPSGVTRNTVSKEVIPPGAPCSTNTRYPPNYQRVLSNESRGSDKESGNG